MTSSGVLSWPFTFTGHDKVADREWPVGVKALFAKKIKDTVSKQAFDQAWMDVDLFRWNLWEMTQFSFASKRYSIFANALQRFPNGDDFFRVAMPSIGQEGAASFEANRGNPKVSLSDVSDGMSWGRYWAYQQCYEMGGFIAQMMVLFFLEMRMNTATTANRCSAFARRLAKKGISNLPPHICRFR